MLKDFQMDKIYFILNLVNLWCKVQGDSTHGEITFSEFFSSKQLFTGVLPCSFAENFQDEKFSLVNSLSKKKKKYWKIISQGAKLVINMLTGEWSDSKILNADSAYLHTPFL